MDSNTADTLPLAAEKLDEVGNFCSDDGRIVSGVVLAIAGTFLFALKSILIKSAFVAGADATLLLMLRLLFSLPFYGGMLLYLRSHASSSSSTPATTRQILASISLGFFGYYLASFLDMAGLERISAQLERLTLFTYPAMVSLLAWMFLEEQLSRRIVVSIVLSYLGIAIMYSQERGESIASATQTTSGIMLVLGAALSYSLYVLFAKPLMQRMGSREFTSYAMIGSAGFIACHFFLTRSFADLMAASPVVYLYGIALAFFCTVIPSFLVSEAIVRLGAARTTIIGSVGPVITMVLAILVLGEPTSAHHLAGMVIVLIGVSFVARK